MKERIKQFFTSLKFKLKDLFFGPQGLPLFLTFFIIGVLFVVFRMKTVELDYKLAELNSKIKKVEIENKELKAKKAKLLSVKNLRKMAKRYRLSQPGQKQIIVIPN